MLEQVIQRLREIDLSRTALRVVDQQKHIALDLNTEDQLFGRGIDSEGNSLGEYAPLTISIKKAKGQPYDRVTLKDTGDFFNGFRADTSEWPVQIYSTDRKARSLAERYGSGIFGLTSDNLDQFTSNIQEPLEQACASAILDAFSVM